MMMVEVGGWVWAALVMVGVWTTQSHAQFRRCEDRDAECPDWASGNLCETDLYFMYQRCPASCKACVGRCWDYDPKCREWSRMKLCENDVNFMRQNCPLSCNVCDATASLRTIASPSFECGKGLPPATRRRRESGRMRISFPSEPEQPSHTPADQRSTLNSPTTHTERGSRTAVESEDDVSVQDAFCGATPISDRFLLTAAHCVFDSKFPVQTVRLGERDFGSENETNSKPVDYVIEQIIVHPNFQPESRVRYGDLALLQTVEQIAFNDLVFPYCVSAQRPGPNTTVTASGFGLVNSTHQSPVLQDVELLVVDTAECENIYRREDHEGQLRLLYPDLLQGRDIMCASYPDRSACEGDSGGPVFVDHEDGRRFLVGIVGSGVSCRGSGASSLPGLFVSVADHVDFIDSVIYGGFT